MEIQKQEKQEKLIFQLQFEIKDVILSFITQNEEPWIIENGTLQIGFIEMNNKNKTLFKINEFVYIVQPIQNIYVGYNKPFRTYIFSKLDNSLIKDPSFNNKETKQEGCYIIQINTQDFQEFDIFEQLCFKHQNNQIVYQDCIKKYMEQQKQYQTRKQMIYEYLNLNHNNKEYNNKYFFNPTRKMLNTQLQHKNKSKQESYKISKYTIFLGRQFKKGFLNLVRVCSFGIYQTGKNISKNIEEKQIIQLTKEEKQYIQNVKDYSNKLIEISGFTAHQLAILNANTVNYVSQKMGDNKNIQINNDIKQIGKGVINAYETVFDGIYEGIDEIKDQVGESSKQVIQQKYGDEAGNAFEQGVESLANVRTAYKDLKGMTIKKITKKTIENTQQNIGKEIKKQNNSQ